MASTMAWSAYGNRCVSACACIWAFYAAAAVQVFRRLITEGPRRRGSVRGDGSDGCDTEEAARETARGSADVCGHVFGLRGTGISRDLKHARSVFAGIGLAVGRSGFRGALKLVGFGRCGSGAWDVLVVRFHCDAFQRS